MHDAFLCTLITKFFHIFHLLKNNQPSYIGILITLVELDIAEGPLPFLLWRRQCNILWESRRVSRHFTGGGDPSSATHH